MSKKKTLSIEKFEIAKLVNGKSIQGGGRRRWSVQNVNTDPYNPVTEATDLPITTGTTTTTDPATTPTQWQTTSMLC